MRHEALRAAAQALEAVSDTPRLDAELLMAHALSVTRQEMLLGDHDCPVAFAALLDRRLAQEPIAYITGRREFWTLTLDVTPDVLIPRPDSETLIEAAVSHFSSPQRRPGPQRKLGAGFQSGPGLRRGDEPSRILDLGTGSGALLLAALDQWPEATGLGIDASDAALGIARRNAERIAPGRASFRLGNWADGIDQRFDLILCNPPYIEDAAELPPDVRDYEPPAALFAGAEGLDDYREIIPTLPHLLAPGGMIAMEIGHTQAHDVSALFRENGLEPDLRHDLGGRPRAIVHLGLGKAFRSS